MEKRERFTYTVLMMLLFGLLCLFKDYDLGPRGALGHGLTIDATVVGSISN